MKIYKILFGEVKGMEEEPKERRKCIHFEIKWKSFCEF